MVHHIEFTTLSETAWLIKWPEQIDKSIHAEVMQVYHYLQENTLEGMLEMVPAYQSLAIYFDDSFLYREDDAWETTLKQKVSAALKSPPIRSAASLLVEIPVCYEADFAPDMQEVCNQTGVSAEAIIQIHSAERYEVMMMGFMPGFPYMGILPEALQTRRKSSPSRAVHPGSVAIAGNQTGIYPLESPGGWNVIGRTPLPLVQLQRENEFLFAPGYQVKFKPISRIAYDLFLQDPPNPFVKSFTV